MKLTLAFLLTVALLAGQAKQGKGRGRGGNGGGGGGGGTPPPVITCISGSTISMAASAWCLGFAGLPTINPTPTAAGWSFNFPPASQGMLIYITTGGSLAFTQTQTMSMTFKLTGNNAVFTSTTMSCPGAPAASFNLYIQHANDTTDPPTWKWWGNPRYPIPNGTYSNSATITIPMTPDKWTDANGEPGTAQPAGFADTLAHVGVVGFTIGGDCFYGHGSQLTSGSASMEVDGFSVK